MKIQTPVILFALLALIGGCTTTQERTTKILDASLGNEFGVYEDLVEYPGDVVCGKSTSVEFSGDIKRVPFIVVGNTANTTPSRTDLAIFCNNDPVAAVKTELGIDYPTQKEVIASIFADFDMLEAALAEYDRDNGYCPSTEQTLSALVTPATVGNTPRNFPEGGYLSELPLDPWGNDYHYVCPPFAGVKTVYRLSSLGSDGAEGGEGDAADIKLSYRRYFEHLDQL